MADNVIADPGSGGATFGTDEISSVHYPRTKLIHGADGTNDGDVSSSNPLPVDVKDNVPGTGATNLGKAVDTAAGGTDTGVALLAVRDDVLTTLTPVDGDYSQVRLTNLGALWTHESPNEINSGNSTTTPLAGDATFTGTGVEVLHHEVVTVFIDASHDSATDGMQFQFSTDGTNWDSSHDFTLTASEAAREFTFATRAQYFRVVYTNGSTLQTHFRLQTILHHRSTITSIHRLVDDVSPDRSARLHKSAIIAQQAGTGNFVPVQATAGGNFKVSLEEVDGAIAGGGTEAAALRVTIANDSTGLLSIDDNGGSLTVDNGGTFLVQVDDVVPGVGATNLGKEEDAVHGSGDTGVMALAVRSDVPTVAGADGDYVPILTNDEGAIWTHDTPNTVDSGNSTTTPLGSGATFTGTGVDVLGWAAITINLDSTHDSATDGMMFQFSQDDTNWDQIHNFTYTAVNGGRSFQFSAHAQYFRVVYINGGTLQTTFRVQTILHHTAPITTIHRLVDDTSPDRSATIHKSVTIAQAAGSGDFIPVQATAGGNFKVSLEEVDGALQGGGTEAGAMRVTVANDSTGLLSVDDNGGSLTVDLPATTSGGSTPYKNLDVDQTEDEVKGTAGQLYWLHAMNLTATKVYLKIYNDTAANIAVGTDVPDLTFPIPTTGDTNGAGFTVNFGSTGLEFDTAITIAATTGLADADTGPPAANALIVNLGYK